MNQINPYRRNCEVMRKFFAKPIFLITAITLVVNIFSNLYVFFISTTPVDLDITSILLCIAMFMFYFTAKSKKPTRFRSSTVMLDIVSIIGIVLSGLAVALLGILSIILFLSVVSAQKPTNPQLNISILMLCLPFLAQSLISVLYFIAMERLTISFKKSLSTVFLRRNGSVMFGIMSIVLALFVVAVGVYMFLYASYDLLVIIPFAVKVVPLILLTYIGFSYNSYIKNLSSSIETIRPVQPLPDKEEEVTNNNPTLNMWAESETFNQPHRQATVTRPVEFTPQAVFGGNRAVEPETNPSRIQIPENDKQNSYVRNSAPPTKRCVKCGKENPNINIFCGNCGSRL